MRLMEENPQEEIFAGDWEYLLERHTGADWELLRDMCVELSFPVREGQSATPEMQAALRRGERPVVPENWVPAGEVKVYLHTTPVGRLPVIECEADEDFIRLQQSLVYRCEPKPVPDTRGATIIKNYNNWVRVDKHRENGAIPKDPALYRDFIMLLSHRYYSGVKPEVFGLNEADWRQKSLVIRREHEAAHYMTQRYYHSSKNEIHDEIIADFMGLTASFGEYDPQKFLAFMFGGRLEIYAQATTELCDTLVKAAMNISKLHDGDRMKTFHTLCRTPVADMARGRFA